MLKLDAVVAGYGKLRVLRGVDFLAAPGKITAVIGRNGAGKTTLMNAIVGLVRVSSGVIEWQGRQIQRTRTDVTVRSGIGLVPQSRGLFFDQTVQENLELAKFAAPHLSRGDFTSELERSYERFPALKARREVSARNLSGGEQQMLAIAKALIPRPKLLLLDEPSIGLAPAIVESLAHTVAALREGDLTIVVTEQNIRWVLGVADDVNVLDDGHIVSAFAKSDAGFDQYVDEIASTYLGRLSPSAGTDRQLTDRADV